MEMTGEQLVPAPQQAVWDALNDPQMLKVCVPGCESIEPTGENAYQVLMVAKVGPVSAKFKGKLTLSDIRPPQSYSIAFEGQGGAAGFAKGGAQVRLSTEGKKTKLAYDVKASVGGKLAQIGSRLVDAAAKKVADDFFRNFNEKVAAMQGDPETTVVIPKEGEEDRPAKEPGDRQLPTLPDSKLASFAGLALVVVLASLIALLA
jgi:carbon monoxide dehydrogenase subunit G